MGLNIRSILTKLLVLVAGAVLVVGALSALYVTASAPSRPDCDRVLREQRVKLGRYIASNLAYNSKYGVLTKDKPLLTQVLEGVMSAGDSDVVGSIVRDVEGAILAQKGASVRDLPLAPAAVPEERDATSDSGEPIILFRAPVTAAGGQKGGVEVAISKRVMTE